MKKRTSRIEKPRITRRLKNTNRIVRVYNNRLNTIFQQLSDELGCPYQLVFDEYCEMSLEMLQLGSHAIKEFVEVRLLDKYTGAD